ncbi:RNA polymerase sigma factor SigM [Actinomycetospora sp. NBRC 106375]|uniref:RNA polymerase sigma factor n=1 Tax=Actinomycetospora sp. NBRC 106375 TaxID=3032207 RepID=UPI0024A185AE|nr:sigma-70 family RNA polymerase sigma factor [Actinomycetospora sp. NBRC 106375]GLZ48926.1 RNA polymerase sigma factor SigM [Actinomycetospora sp. NBRC 106375]
MPAVQGSIRSGEASARGLGARPESAQAIEDGWLLAKARGGEVEAFEVLVGRHRDRIYRISLRMLGSREDAEDVTQDVVVQMWTGLAAFSGSSSFVTYLHRLVVNRCLNRIRHARTTVTLPDTGDPQHPRSAGVGERVQDRAELASATRALEALSPEVRTVFVLCQLEGMTYRQAAAMCSVSEDVVRGRLARARAGLTAAMREWT